MDDDLAVPAALAVLQGVVREGNKLLADGPSDGAARRAGLRPARCSTCSASTRCRRPGPAPAATSDLHGVVDRLVGVALQERAEARARKDCAAADRVRDALAAAGVAVEDTPTGPRWTLADSPIEETP